MLVLHAYFRQDMLLQQSKRLSPQHPDNTSKNHRSRRQIPGAQKKGVQARKLGPRDEPAHTVVHTLNANSFIRFSK